MPTMFGRRPSPRRVSYPAHRSIDRRDRMTERLVTSLRQPWRSKNKITTTTRAQLLPRMADRTRAVKTTLFTSALRRIFSNR